MTKSGQPGHSVAEESENCVTDSIFSAQNLCCAQCRDMKKEKTRKRNFKIKMAEATGLEPATSTVTGWHSNQLSYASASLMMPLMYAIISIFQAGF